jgi:hypothetical protein
MTTTLSTINSASPVITANVSAKKPSKKEKKLAKQATKIVPMVSPATPAIVAVIVPEMSREQKIADVGERIKALQAKIEAREKERQAVVAPKIEYKARAEIAKRGELIKLSEGLYVRRVLILAGSNFSIVFEFSTLKVVKTGTGSASTVWTNISQEMAQVFSQCSGIEFAHRLATIAL